MTPQKVHVRALHASTPFNSNKESIINGKIGSGNLSNGEIGVRVESVGIDGSAIRGGGVAEVDLGMAEAQSTEEGELSQFHLH